MRRVLTRIVLVALSSASALLVSQSPAVAEPTCQVTDPQTGQCLIWIEVGPEQPAQGNPGNEEPSDSGTGPACFWDPTKQGLTGPPAGPVPCTAESGYWSNSYNCYISPAEPQPPASDPSWQGHEPGDGAIYQCYQPQTDIVIFIWSQNPPPGPSTGPTPREVAQLAMDQMNLRAIDIGVAPEPGPDSIGLVGMPVWMWASSPDADTYGPATASASAGGITVTATARVDTITWDMGDGNEVVCGSAGTPYEPTYGQQESPDCGHTYEKSSSLEASGKYTVTAASNWVVAWAGAGQSGTIRLNDLQRSVEVAIGEAQVLVDSGRRSVKGRAHDQYDHARRQNGRQGVDGGRYSACAASQVAAASRPRCRGRRCDLSRRPTCRVGLDRDH